MVPLQVGMRAEMGKAEEGGGFAAPLGADEGDDLVLFDGEGDSVEGFPMKCRSVR